MFIMYNHNRALYLSYLNVVIDNYFSLSMHDLLKCIINIEASDSADIYITIAPI
jgi:hypothetical protein